MATKQQKPLIVITGPTASGKTAIALELAKKYNGEIICADSRTVYRGMDIGTAKPTQQEQKEVKHHLLDVVNLDEKFTAADFQRLAKEAITDIYMRDKVPFLVGGTGLYIDSIVFNYQFGVQAESGLRYKLEKLTVEQLWEYCVKNNIELPENKYNKRYVIRAIEQNGVNNRRKTTPINNSYIVGISTEKTILHRRIMQRIDMMFKAGVVSEASNLAKRYGWEIEAMTANIYRLAHKVNNKELSETEAKQQLTTLDWRLAKRQLTWLKRNPHIQWSENKVAYEQISKFLKSHQTA